MTKTADDTAFLTIAERVDPPFTPQEVDLGVRRITAGADPVTAAEQIVDERVGMSSRAVRAREGDPYPPCDTLLDKADRRRYAEAKIDAEVGPAEPAPPEPPPPPTKPGGLP